MGYYTDFNLSFKSIDSDSILEELNSITGYSWDNDFRLDDVKWYDFDKDMKQISRKYPDVILKLKGDGEEKDDVWVRYYKNGKVQNAKIDIVVEPFDESKLK